MDGGQFLKFDVEGHTRIASIGGHNAFDGNPVGYYWDPDGRFGKQIWDALNRPVPPGPYGGDQPWYPGLGSNGNQRTPDYALTQYPNPNDPDYQTALQRTQ